MTNTTGYRKPWTDGAKAYPEVDTQAGMLAAIYRKRNSFHAITRQGTALYATQTCAVCGQRLATQTDGYAYVTISPKQKTAIFKHYNCAWQSLMVQLVNHRVTIR